MLQIQKNLSNTFYALLALPATAMGFALSVQIAALSWILSTQFGLDIKDVGLVWAAGPLAGIIGQVIVGVISDKVWFWNGRRRPFILIGGVLAALMLLSLPSIGVINDALGLDAIVGIAILVALILDLAINVSFNPTRSIIADVTPEGRERTKGYTWMQTVSGTFGVLAYLIGAIWGNFVLIYFGVGLVLLFSIIPPFFIKEPKYLGQYGREDEDILRDLSPDAAGGAAHQHPDAEASGNDSSFFEMVKTIRPLWGFFIYSAYALAARFGMPEFPGYYFEIIMLIVTVALIGEALLKKEEGKSRLEAGKIGFQKVLAAHSFTWIGVQTMFIYLYAFVDFRIPELSDMQLGQVIAWSFLVLNLVGALLPATILEPMAARIGRVKTHAMCIGIMAVGYTGVLFLGNTPILLYLMMAVVGVGWAATISLPFAIMSQKIPQARMGLYMGLFNLSVVLPQLVASLGVGELINKTPDKSITFIVCAATVAFSALAWTLVKEPEDRQLDNPVTGGGH